MLKVRKCAKRCLFSIPNLRTRESIVKQRKIGHKTRFVYFGRAICAIHYRLEKDVKMLLQLATAYKS